MLCLEWLVLDSIPSKDCSFVSGVSEFAVWFWWFVRFELFEVVVVEISRMVSDS